MADRIPCEMTADALGEIISDAVHNVNDVGGMTAKCWVQVAEEVAAALGISLEPEGE